MLEEMPTSLNIAPLKERIKWIDKLSIREIAALQYMNGEPENFRDYDMEKMAKGMYIVQFASADDFLEKRTLDSMMGEFGNNRIYAAIVDEKITCMSRLPDDEVRIWVANLIFDPTLMHIDKFSLIRNKYGRLIRSGNIDSPITSDTKYIEEIAEKIVDFAIENGYAHPEASNEQKLKLKVWYDTKELEEKLIELCRNGELNYSAYENIKVKIQNSFESGRSEKYWCIPADPASLSETDRLKYYDSSDPLNYFYRHNMDAAYCLHIHKNELKRYLQEHGSMLKQNSLLSTWLSPNVATEIIISKQIPEQFDNSINKKEVFEERLCYDFPPDGTPSLQKGKNMYRSGLIIKEAISACKDMLNITSQERKIIKQKLKQDKSFFKDLYTKNPYGWDKAFKLAWAMSSGPTLILISHDENKERKQPRKSTILLSAHHHKLFAKTENMWVPKEIAIELQTASPTIDDLYTKWSEIIKQAYLAEAENGSSRRPALGYILEKSRREISAPY